MDRNQYHSFIYELSEIQRSLNKIIELLEFRNSIEVARDEMRDGSVLDNGSHCTCEQNKTGSTASWICPIHGQRF